MQGLPGRLWPGARRQKALLFEFPARPLQNRPLPSLKLHKNIKPREQLPHGVTVHGLRMNL